MIQAMRTRDPFVMGRPRIAMGVRDHFYEGTRNPYACGRLRDGGGLM
jgi:hypothetical protein